MPAADIDDMAGAHQCRQPGERFCHPQSGRPPAAIKSLACNGVRDQ
jgi:hypothetical protein